MAGDRWEKKLVEMLSETDLNISSLKRNIAPNYRSPRASYYPDRAEENVPKVPLSSTLKTPSKMLFGNDVFMKENFSDEIGKSENGISLFASLSRKSEDVELKLGSLTKTVATLQYENKMQNEEIKRLKGELKHFSKRMSEKGVHMSTESKMKEWQQQMRSELDIVNKLLTSRQNLDDFGDHSKSLVSLSRDLTESKRLLQDEADSARRETDNLRTRILKLENDAASVISDIREISTDVERVKKEIRNACGRSNPNVFSVTRNDFAYMKREISVLRDKIEIFEEELQKNYSSQCKSQGHSKKRTHKKDQILPQTEKISKSKQQKDKLRKEIHVEDEIDDSILTTELDDLSLSSSVLLSDDDYLSSLEDETGFSFRKDIDNDILSIDERKSETLSDFGDTF